MIIVRPVLLAHLFILFSFCFSACFDSGSDNSDDGDEDKYSGEEQSGGLNQPCNPDKSCDEGLVCDENDTCILDSNPENGGLNQPCNPDNSCDLPYVCMNGICTEDSDPESGDVGQPCNSDGTCNDGLECSSEFVCYRPSVIPDGDDTTDGDNMPDGDDYVDGDGQTGDMDDFIDGDFDMADEDFGELDMSENYTDYEYELPDTDPNDRPPIYISFLWHMHQPIYWPYEKVTETASNHPGFPGGDVGLYGIFTNRSGPYTSWPKDAVGKGLDLPHLGAQVSFSGSLMENLNNLAAGGVAFGNWQSSWSSALGWETELGNKRLELVNFGYHHPLMGLIDYLDIRLQIQMHREMLSDNIGWAASKGIFPPECAFSPRMIPALLDEGIEWVLVDNIHFDRTHKNYPWVAQSGLPRPNPAEQLSQPQTNWVQLQNIWAPSQVSAPWGYQPHYVSYIDPDSGERHKIIAVPAARYEGNEDGRGGFGALQYESVMSQIEFANVDPAHPILIVLHHDGDNYGGGTDAYYGSNFQNFVNWLKENPDRFVATTIQDYLDMFPPEENDIINVEDGSWAGADNGDPQFLKWNGGFNDEGYSPDRNSWGIMTAARNRVMTAEAVQPHSSVDAIINKTGNNTDKAWHHLLNGETSCYWYWDGQADWDSHPARAANLAVQYADAAIGSTSDESVPPTIYIPQRNPYNPGADAQTTNDVEIWTYVYDVSGLDYVALKYRVDSDGVRTPANDVYSPSGSWESQLMDSVLTPSETSPAPQYQARRYFSTISDLSSVLIDYFVEARDGKGNIKRSPIQHVWIGSAGGSSGGGLWKPDNPTHDDEITITWTQAAKLHWGVNNWTKPEEKYWPAGTVAWSDGKAVETPLDGPDGQGKYTITIGPFDNEISSVNFVFHNNDGSWSSPDQTISISD